MTEAQYQANRLKAKRMQNVRLIAIAIPIALLTASVCFAIAYAVSH